MMMMTLPQPDCIYLVGHLAKSFKKNVPQASNRLNKLTDIYTTLHSDKEPMGLDKRNSKTNHVQSEENVTSTPGQTSNEQSLGRKCNPQR